MYVVIPYSLLFYDSCFFFNNPPPPQFYTLSLHDALPIYPVLQGLEDRVLGEGRRNRDHRALDRAAVVVDRLGDRVEQDRKSTRLNSSHANISYAVFCLKKKKNAPLHTRH